MTALTTADASNLFRKPPERFLDVGAGEVAYRRVGTGPDVLFVHGWPVSGATFRLLLPHLVEHITCHVIDLPGAGSSRFTTTTELTVAQHIETVRRVVDILEFTDVAIVGHDSGGLIARTAMVGDDRLRAMGLIDTEQIRSGLLFKSFLAARHLPGVGRGLGWVAVQPKIRRHRLVFGGSFVDRSFLDGEFNEFFLQPLHDDPARLDAAAKVLKSFDFDYLRQLDAIHQRIDVPVQLVWGERDPFFPVKWAREMVATFPDAQLHVVGGAALFSHEERPAEVAAALLPTLRGDRSPLEPG